MLLLNDADENDDEQIRTAHRGFRAHAKLRFSVISLPFNPNLASLLQE